MIKVNDEIVNLNDKFGDGTFSFKFYPKDSNRAQKEINIEWFFDSNEEFIALSFLTKHIKYSFNNAKINLYMPYVPNARQDRIKNKYDIFTLKYFIEMINDLHFNYIRILDPHSYVSEALFNTKLIVENNESLLLFAIGYENPCFFFFPDEGAMKRYSGIMSRPYTFGLKSRDWNTGEVRCNGIIGDIDKYINNQNVMIVDDICASGDTLYLSAKRLKELGAKRISCCVTHCENRVINSELINSNVLDAMYATDSIFTKSHDKIHIKSLRKG